MSSPTSRNGVAAFVLAVLLIFTLYFSDTHRSLYRIGKAVACKDDSVFKDVQAEILEYGLQDVRGLATDASGRYLYVTEANRPILIYDTNPVPIQTDSKHPDSPFINSDQDLTCRDGECEDLDDRDVAIAGEQAFIAEHGKGKILLRMVDKDHSLGTSVLWDPKWTDILDTPAGVSVSQDAIFVSTDSPPNASVKALEPTKMGGALYVVCRTGDCKPDLISDNLRHPSGVLSRGPNGPVYVADDDGDFVRWAIFRKVPDRGWIHDGFLASVPKTVVTMPRFLGIAFSPVKQMIFAAGPAGIYAFTVHGASIGRMVFGEPVSGVTLSQKWLYLVVGHMLCRISLDKVKETNEDLPGLETLRLEPGQRDPAEPDLTPSTRQPDGGPGGDTISKKPPSDSSKRPQSHPSSDSSHIPNKALGSLPPAPTLSIAKPFHPPPGRPGHRRVHRVPPSNRSNCPCAQKRTPERPL